MDGAGAMLGADGHNIASRLLHGFLQVVRLVAGDRHRMNDIGGATIEFQDDMSLAVVVDDFCRVEGNVNESSHNLSGGLSALILGVGYPTKREPVVGFAELGLIVDVNLDERKHPITEAAIIPLG